MVVEECGPVRATIRVRGAFANAKGEPWMRYLCRVHIHANQPWVRLEASLDNDALEPTMSLVSRFELPLARQLRHPRRSLAWVPVPTT